MKCHGCPSSSLDAGVGTRAWQLPEAYWELLRGHRDGIYLPALRGAALEWRRWKACAVGNLETLRSQTQMLSVPSSVCLLITALREMMLRAGSGTCESYLHSIDRAVYQRKFGSYCPCFTTMATEFRGEELS